MPRLSSTCNIASALVAWPSHVTALDTESLMQSLESNNPRGAVWNRWDPHIHAPGTILSDQYIGSDPWGDFLSHIEKSNPSIRALGITDYYSIALYEQVVQRKRDGGRLANVDLIFPNVEMRFGIGTAKGSGINFHVLFSPEYPDHTARVKRFLAELHFRFQGESYCCEASDLVRLGKAYDQSVRDERIALEIGVNQFKVNFEELRTRWRESAWVQQNALVAVAGGRNDGTSALSEDASFTALRREIETFAHIIFSASPQQREFWLGKGVVSTEELSEKWGGCKPCLHGSDAHKTAKVGKPDLDRFCWIKGDLTFESLRQACLEPEGRALVHSEPPVGALPSQTMETVELSNAPWFSTKVVPLNPGLIAIIGARGSGKTALADLIASGAYALSPHPNASSFVHRAAKHLTHSVTSLTWQSGDKTETPLSGVSTDEPFESPRVRYLSQQFVEQLCSAEGVEDELLTEIERVMFHSHSIEDRLGAPSFRDLLDIRLARARSARGRQEQSLRLASESLTTERTRKASLVGLTRQREEKFKLIEKDKKDRKALTAKGTKERVQRLEEISSAVDAARLRVEDAKTRHRSLLLLEDAVASLRKSSGPAYLKDLRKNYADAALTEAQWKSFELTFAGDVDSILKAELIAADKLIKILSGPGEGEIEPDNRAQPSVSAYIQQNANLVKQTLSLLEKELTRLRRLVGIDAANAKKLTTLSEKIAKDESALSKLDKEIVLAAGAETRI